MTNENFPNPGTADDSSIDTKHGPAVVAARDPGLLTFRSSLSSDLLSGFLVFLIALPLCLAISLASGYPPIAGVYTAIIGGILTTFISNSQLTIKGPAAGLIVIAVNAILEFGGGPGKSVQDNQLAYQLALAVGIAAGLIQVTFGLLKLGDIIGDFFPTAAVHGMLASIGVIIAVKQIHIALGVQGVKGNPFMQIAAIPNTVLNLNPKIAAIGLSSLLILFGLPLIRNRYIRRIPAPMLVLIVSVTLGLLFGLHETSNYRLGNRTYVIGPEYEVNLPSNMVQGIAHPNFAALTDPKWAMIGWKYVLMFALVGSLESLLSAKAIDLIDPWRRKTSLNRDLLAIGVANTVAAGVGGLPMISEIVRSKANIDNGARTRMADLFHALFLLVCVYAIPGILNHIPLAALAAMLVYTGFRLASPREFVHAYKVGVEQLIIFLVTLFTTLATDLLIGIAAGVVAKFVIHLFNGAPFGAMIKPSIILERPDDHTTLVKVKQAVVFTNWLWLKGTLGKIDPKDDVILDLSETRLVDHTVMEKLRELEADFKRGGRTFRIVGLEEHRPMSSHPDAARKKNGKPTKVG